MLVAGCGKKEPVVSFRADIPAGTVDPEVFRKFYPKQYDGYMKNAEMSTAATVYGGSKEIDKLEQWPFLKTMFAGMPFSKDYKEDRGHVYSMEDLLKIKRINEKSIAACYTCKSANVPAVYKEMGDAYYSTNFHQIKDKFSQPITCANCHDPKTMNLVIVQPPLRDALKRMGKDPDKLPTQELRSLVCAQCHVEYYFTPDKKVVTFPWDKGFSPSDILAYYNEIDFKDWAYPESGASMLKVQHPEYELFQGSVHQAAGVSCADCHMPYKVEGGEKISSHWWTSPLNHIQESCGTCHRQDTNWLRERVLYTQDKTAEMMSKAGSILVEAIKTIDEAVKVGGNTQALEEARKLHREAQWYLDWVAAENSMGFHNPQQALETLGKSIDAAYRARLKALEAMK